jgi:PAS domain-containing protein
MVGKYKVITLCGSTRFKDEFMEAQKRLTLEGNIVISVGLFGHSGDSEVWDGMDEGTLSETKEMLDDMHKRKIDMADEIFVINVGGYIGSSTKSEIEYAKKTGKPVKYLEAPYVSFYKSVLDQDRVAVVICNLKHEIIYMNPVAIEHYQKWGGEKRIGANLLDCHNEESREKIQRVIDWFSEDESHNIVYTYHNEELQKDVYMVGLRDDTGKLIGYYEKHEFRNPETMKLYDLW